MNLRLFTNFPWPSRSRKPEAKPERKASRIEVYIDDVHEDLHAARLSVDFKKGRMTIEQFAALVLATGRLQGHYMSSRTLATEAHLVCDYNAQRDQRERSQPSG